MIPEAGSGASAPAPRRSRRFLNAPLSIGAFIGALHLLIGLLGAGIITAFALYFIYHGGVESSLREIEGMSAVTRNALEAPLQAYRRGEVSAAELEAMLARYVQSRPEVRFSLLSTDGASLLPNARACEVLEPGLDAPEVQGALARGLSSDIRDCARGVRTIFVGASVEPTAAEAASPAPRGQTAGVLVLAVPLGDMLAPTYSVMRWMGVVALMIVAVTVFEGWLGSKYISKPLARLSAVAERFGRGDLTARADVTGPQEVIHLARIFNSMASYMQTSLETMRTFVANASHELRTPLTGMKLQVGALTGGAIEDANLANRFLTQIEGEIDRLTSMVNDMLDLTQIESGARMVRQPVDLLELAREVRAFWEARSRQVGLTLQLITEDRTPPVKGDPYRLRQMFDNLLDNAIKYTPPGGHVDIALSRGWVEGRHVVRIEVRDTGMGIEPAALPHIFDRFFRVERKREGGASAGGGRIEGSGIGLAIARSIVTAHGGVIGVESTPGVGSTFWVELPV